jgi:hypothetical protein
MAKHTRVDARNARGSELAIQEQITDTPILPPAERMAAYLAMHDAEVTGSVIGGATVVGLVSAFLIGSKKK